MDKNKIGLKVKMEDKGESKKKEGRHEVKKARTMWKYRKEL